MFILYPLGLPEYEPKSFEYALMPPSEEFKFPFESFVFITVDSEEMGGISLSASGIIVQSMNKSKTHILTAGHACEPKMALLGLTQPPEGEYKSASEVIVYDYFGYPHDAIIVDLSFEHDLCLLETTDIWNQGLPLSSSMPHTGEKVYSIAAPRSIFSPGNALIFDGYYTGLDQFMDAYFTIPARPGSSGAGIFNRQGKIVGIVHSAAADLEHVSIATPVYDIDRFLSEHIMVVTY
jgi:hypothetical protein